MKTVITYGTFDLLHYGHIELLRRAKELAEGGKLIVGLSTDEFNTIKGKTSRMPYAKRKALIEAIRYVDQVVPEESWGQKENDVKKHNVDVFVMGKDWAGKFDELEKFCNVVYLERTPTISSAAIKGIIAELEKVEAEAA
jgi:glycerol-3-phosphate cytidylyltransferase